jgi:sugar phosphate isomerase/epimerase
VKLGAYTACLHDKPVADALKILRDLGLDSAEINSGGFLPAPHLPIDAIRDSKDARDEYLGLFESSEVALTATATPSTRTRSCAPSTARTSATRSSSPPCWASSGS